MRSFVHVAIAAVAVTSLAGCADKVKLSAQPAKAYSVDEKLFDFDTAVNQFRNQYAPLKYKEARFGRNYEETFAQLRKEVEASTNDVAFYSVLGKLVRSFEDGHVSVQIPGLTRYSLPFALDHFDGHYIVVNIDPAFAEVTGLAKGDEVVKLDGVPVADVAASRLQFYSLGYARADQRLGAFLVTNPRYQTPIALRAYVEVKRATDGAKFTFPAYWTIAASKPGIDLPKNDLQSRVGEAGILEFGAATPFFVTGQTQAEFKFARVGLVAEEWDSAISDKGPADVYGVFYRYAGKNILLLRIPSYDVDALELKRSIETYKRLLQKYESAADVLVIDQTHNPGGSVIYVEELARLFMKVPGPSFGFAPRADRGWLRAIESWIAESAADPAAVQHLKTMYTEIDLAHERGDFLGPQVALTRSSTTMVENTAWSKPVLVLIDELCGSGGDGFPMLMKGNKTAKLWGHRTAGLGGNVGMMPPLPNSNAQFQLTRSLFYLATSDGSLPKEALIENNGVTPDVQRDYGLKDYREGFTSYVEDFSKAAIELTK